MKELVRKKDGKLHDENGKSIFVHDIILIEKERRNESEKENRKKPLIELCKL